VPEASAGSQYGVRDREFMGGRARVHMRIVQHQILDMNQLAAHPQSRNGIEEMPALAEPIADGMSQDPLV
jgi:hypothetical protein